MQFLPKRHSPDTTAYDGRRRQSGFVFPLPTILALGLGVVVYVVVASALNFYPATIAVDPINAITIRIVESGVLWYMLCTATGWWRRHRGRLAPTKARCWPLTGLLLILGLTVAAINALRYTSPWPGSMPAPGHIVLWIALGIGVTGPMLIAAGAALSLQQQARWWRVPADPAVICPCCNYDLRGNASGRCPECGTTVEHDPHIPRSFYARGRYWIFPELAEFASPGERHAAWRRALAEDQVKYDGIIVIVLLGGMALLNVTRWRPWLEENWWWTMAVVATVILILLLASRRRMRRYLREQLTVSSRLSQNAAAKTDMHSSVGDA